MASASVHLAVLVIAKDPVRADLAAGDVVATRAAAAGHRVISRHSVDDSEAAIRSQLARWIDDRQVDVVVVLSGGSPTVKKTLATLVTEPVPGLPDAIRCGATFVFVVPGAAGPGMDKLVLPHLDPARPSSLIAQIPRLQANKEGVPLPIAPEKTEGGSGVPARMPAAASARAKQKTGANVISRHKPDEDPPTKPIDVARLERQLAKSTTPSHDDVTRPEIALILPRLPPGASDDASDDDDDEDQLDDHTATDTVAVQPAPPLPPAGRPRPATGAQRTVPSVVKPKPTGEPKPFSFSTPVRGGPPSPPRDRTSTGAPGSSARDTKPPIPRESTATGTPAYSAKDAKPRTSSPSTPPPPREPWRAKSTSSGTPAYPAVTPPLPVVPVPEVPAPTEVVEELEPDGEDSAENEAKWEATIAAANAEAEAATAKAEAAAATAKAEAAAAKAEAEAATAKAEAAAAKAEAAAAKAEAAAARAEVEAANATVEAAKAEAEAATATAAVEPEVVDVPELVEVAEPKTEAPPPARVRQPTTPPPARVRPPTTPPPLPGRPVRTPTVPPPANITDNDLPRGAFTYPAEPRRSNVVLKVIAAIGVTVLGFFAVVYFLDKKDPPPAKVATGTPAPPNDAPAVVVAVAADAAEPEIEIDTTEPATPTGSAGIRGGSASMPTPRPRPGTPTPRPVTTPTGSDGDATAPPAPTPAPDPQFTDADLCDEANCVVSDYDRPCCAKYKAKGPVLSQRIGGVPQTLDRTMVRAGVDGIKPRVIKCGEKAGVTGTVKIAVSVSPDGAVTAADVQDTPDAALGTCVADALRASKFGKSIDGGSFTYPFVF